MILSNIGMLRRLHLSRYNHPRTVQFNRPNSRMIATEKTKLQVPKIELSANAIQMNLIEIKTLPLKDAGLMFVCNVAAAVGVVILVSLIDEAVYGSDIEQLSIYQLEK